MKRNTAIDFSIFCDSALEFYTDAYKSVIRLAQNEQTNRNSAGVAYAREEAERKCRNAIYSCMSDADRLKHGITDFDIIEFLNNTGIIVGSYSKGKKNAAEKVKMFKSFIERSRLGVENPITIFLITLEALERTGCITVNKEIGTVSRTVFESSEPHKYNAAMENARTKVLKYIECAETSQAINDEIKPVGYRGSATNPYSGGSFSHK